MKRFLKVWKACSQSFSFETHVFLSYFEDSLNSICVDSDKDSVVVGEGQKRTDFCDSCCLFTIHDCSDFLGIYSDPNNDFYNESKVLGCFGLELIFLTFRVTLLLTCRRRTWETLDLCPLRKPENEINI